MNSKCCCSCDWSDIPNDGSHLHTPEAQNAMSKMFHPDSETGLMRWGYGYVGGIAVGYCPKCKHAYGAD